MKIEGKIREASFLQRLNRFSALVELEGSEEVVYLANSGRMEELLQPGRPVLLEERFAPQRKTCYDLIIVALGEKGEKMVSVDARVPAKLVYEALLRGALPHFKGYSSIYREATLGQSRLDFLLSGSNRFCFLEVKSVTLVRQGRALFPDAPTPRGRRHLRELIQAKREGYEAAIVFVIQREDAFALSPNDEMDPEFGRDLREAEERGVSIYAYGSRVSQGEITLAEEIPVSLMSRCQIG